MTPTVSPGLISNEIFFNTFSSGSSGKAKEKLLNLIPPLISEGMITSPLSLISTSSSKIEEILLKEVLPLAVKLMIEARANTGQMI